MTVEVLRLSGLRGGDADQVVGALLADQRSHPDLSRLLVIDDTAALIGHSEVFECLLTSRRLDHLLCVAVGPRAGDSREFRFPGNIGGAQGSAVLWVSDPHGIDWRLAASAVAVGHSGNSASGLDHLIALLSVDEVFDRVCEIARHLPGGVASPGIRLAGADDEAASFAAALVMVIRRLTTREPGLAAGADEPFKALLGAPAGTVNLAEHGELSRCREDVAASAGTAADAATRWAGVSGMLGSGPPEVRAHVIGTGSALGAFRDRVVRLLRDAHAPGGLTDKQRGQLTAAGVRLPGPPPAAPGGGLGAEVGSGRSAVYRAIAEAVRGGDPLPRVTKRLNLTASAIHHGGSASYLSQVDQVCAPELLGRLAEPPAPPRQPRWWLPAGGALAALLGALAAVGWNVAAGVAVGVITLVLVVTVAVLSWRTRFGAWRRRLALDEAVDSTDALADLIVTVAAREWSGGNVTRDEITRARIALDGVAKRLTEHADAAGDPGRWALASRAARLSESLMPSLRDLVVAALAAGSASDGGQAAFEQARARTTDLITDWTEYARKHGALAPPPFATSAANDVPYADQGEMAEITEAVQYDPHGVMWQLCLAADLSALDVAGTPQVVAFAPRLTRQPLADVLRPDTVWTSSGEHAGLLRLVPLRAGIASTSWIAAERRQEPPR